MKLSKIKPNPKNPRKISPEALDRLKRSIERDPEFMRLRPIVVDGDGMILGGNQRYAAIKALGMKEIPAEWVVAADWIDDEKRRRFVLVDNAPDGMAGEWDMDLLSVDWDAGELKELGLQIAGLEYVDEISPPGLEGGDRAPIRQMTFTVHDEQFLTITAAIAEAKKRGGDVSEKNENSNGNALAFICGVFNGQG